MRIFGKAKPLTPEQSAPEASLLPHHVAIIMDGNGRWAKAKGQPRAFGHRAGTEALRAIIRESSDLGIEALSLYAFSTENWLRPAEEINALMGLILEFFAKEIDELDEKGVCIRILGDLDGMPGPQRDALHEAMCRTSSNTGLKLNIALNYGSRAEWVRAVQRLAQRAVDGEIAPEAIGEAQISEELYTAGLPDVDLLIRTSGEMRISNFMLYQIAYAELVFVDCFWPDFDRTRYYEALRVFASRNRRFGGLATENEVSEVSRARGYFAHFDRRPIPLRVLGFDPAESPAALSSVLVSLRETDGRPGLSDRLGPGASTAGRVRNSSGEKSTALSPTLPKAIGWADKEVKRKRRRALQPHAKHTAVRSCCL